MTARSAQIPAHTGEQLTGERLTGERLTGEQAVRRRAGFDRPGYSGPSRSRRIPAIAADFLAAQPMLVLGAAAPDGRLWASLLTGPPGFLHAERSATANTSDADAAPDALAVGARPLPGDPLATALDSPGQVGMIALEPARRRRMRMNGLAAPTGSGLRVTLDEVFANCPKYIQGREYHQTPAADRQTPHHGIELTVRQSLAISCADTFFITTADHAGRLDASHRGGNPGFVQILGPDRLRWPDYSGNAMFCTLGNLAENPAAGLLFVDWETGTTLQLTGTARTDWDPAHAAEVPGAQRLVEFTIVEVVETPATVPLRWTDPEYSRFNPPAPQSTPQ